MPKSPNKEPLVGVQQPQRRSYKKKQNSIDWTIQNSETPIRLIPFISVTTKRQNRQQFEYRLLAVNSTPVCFRSSFIRWKGQHCMH